MRVYSHSRCLILPNERQELLILGRDKDGNKRRTGPPAPCKCCGVVGLIMARGLKESCYSHWLRYGDISRFPPTRKPGEYELEQGAALSRYERYMKLTTGPGALSRNRACIVLGISTRTAYRYEALARVRARETESVSGQDA